MRNVTISLEDYLLNAGRKYAKNQHTTLNNLIRKLLENTVLKKSGDWIDEWFGNMDRVNGNSRGKKWKREELYNG